jgi:hypothetical protein
MALIVEDGTVVTDANAYITVQFFRDWHEARGLTAAATNGGEFLTALIEAAIIKATDYVDKRFGVKFVGFVRTANPQQSLMWPRLDAFTNQGDYIHTNIVPKELKRGVVEYSLIALKLINLLPVPAPSFNSIDLDTGETSVAKGGLIQREKEKVGPIEEETWFNQEQWRLVLNGRAPGPNSDMSSLVNLPEYPVADEWLKPIVKTGLSVKLSRG